jgi:alkylated DNA repair dioxygenase AlkB
VPDWRPGEIFVRRYRQGSAGMSPHRDGKRFLLLVATLTVAGTADFFRHNENGEVTATWPLVPGDLVLLRGMGSHGVPDGRPFHSVGGPAGDLRCSVAFRMSS